MKRVKNVFLESEEVYEIICNMCAKSIKKDEVGRFFDHLSVTKYWGYLSENDGQTHEFDLCEDCYNKFIQDFKIDLI